MSFLANMLKKTAPTHFAQVYKMGHDRSFHLLEARRGRGKSYSMAYWALCVARQKIGIAANFHLNHYHLAQRLVQEGVWPDLETALDWCRRNVTYVNTWDEIMVQYDKLVLLDEINRLFDSQDKSKEDRVPKVVLEWLQLSRRNKITLVCAAQSLDWLTNRIRQLFDLLWRAKKEMSRGKRANQIQKFWLYGADPWSKGLSADVQRGADFRMSIPFDSRIFTLYDTLERIQAVENKSRFDKFWDVYQHQLATGIIPPPPPPPRPAPRCGLCWVKLGGRRASMTTSAVREEEAPPVGRHVTRCGSPVAVVV